MDITGPHLYSRHEMNKFLAENMYGRSTLGHEKKKAQVVVVVVVVSVRREPLSPGFSVVKK